MESCPTTTPAEEKKTISKRMYEDVADKLCKGKLK